MSSNTGEEVTNHDSLESTDEDTLAQNYRQRDSEVFDCKMDKYELVKKTTRPQKKFFCFEFTKQEKSRHTEYYLDTNDVILKLKQKYRHINYIEIRQHKMNLDAYYVFIQQTRRCILIKGFGKYLQKHYEAWKAEECDIYNICAADLESSIIAVHGIYRHRHNHEHRPSSSIVPIKHHKDIVNSKNDRKIPLESDISNNLSMRVGGSREITTPAGRVDVMTEQTITEVKYFRHWKAALGQILAYGTFHEKQKVLHLFTGVKEAECAFNMLPMIKMVCTPSNVLVTLELC